jgi:hypothetical protein
LIPQAARELAEAPYTISPQGEDTLTVRNSNHALLKAFLKERRLDHIRGKTRSFPA